MAGAAVLATAVVVGAAAMAGMALLGDLGDRLGPGCKDLLQGIAGMALLGVGAGLSRSTKSNPLGLAAVEELPIPVVIAKGKVGNMVFTDVNQKSRPRAQANPDHLTLISDRVSAKALKNRKPMPNGNMAEAHAEVAVIQQAYEKGMTKGQDMTMSVAGMDVCEFCRSDVVAMAKAAELKSLTIYQHKSEATLFWEFGMKKITRRANENAFIVD
jgi:filamentous hemagglutinin